MIKWPSFFKHLFTSDTNLKGSKICSKIILQIITSNFPFGSDLESVTSPIVNFAILPNFIFASFNASFEISQPYSSLLFPLNNLNKDPIHSEIKVGDKLN